MSFLNPLALIGLTLVSLPVIIHLLTRRRARRLDFPTLRFLRETPSFRLRPRRIRQPLLLLLRVLAFVILILGIARPLITLPSRPRPLRLILIDASLSMRAAGRAEAAREQARLLINNLSNDERAAVVAVSSEATVLAATTADRQQLLVAVERYQPGSGAADFNNGLATAVALMEREAPGTAQVDLISDFQQSNLAKLAEHAAPLPTRVIPHAVGANMERNAFLLNEAALKNESGIELSAAEIVSATDGRSGSRRAWTLDASAGERPDVNWRTEENGQLTGRMRTLSPDDFDADDERFFAFAPAPNARVLLVESDAETSLYAGAALEAAASSLNKNHSSLTRQRQLPARAEELDSYSLVVLTLHGALSADELRLLTAFAEAGGTIWLFLSRDADTARLNALAATTEGRALPFTALTRLSGDVSLSVGAADLSAPELRAMSEGSFQSLRAVNVREGFALEPRAGADTLMRWSNGAAAFISARTGGGRFLLFGTSIERASSDMGNSPALPSLAFSILHLTTTPREPLSYTLGEAVNLGLAPETLLTITNGDGRIAQQVRAGELMQRPLGIFNKPGIYRLEWEGQTRFVALNTPGAESERALADAAQIEQYLNYKEPVTTTTNDNAWRETVERGGNAWRYFLVAAFILLLVELFIRVRQRSDERAAVDVVNTH